MPYAARKTLKTLSAVFVATLGLLVVPAVAVEFGALTLKSNLGETLLAEIPVRAEAGDVLDGRCIKASASSRGSLPVVADVGLQMITRGAESILMVQSAQVLVEPAALLLLEANCGSGRVWHEIPVLPKPARLGVSTSPTSPSTSWVASSGEWVVAPGESPLSLARVLFPKQLAVQRRFIQALSEANPAAGIDSAGTKPLLAGSLLTMPDWRTLSAGGVASEARQKDISEPKHQISITLPVTEKAGMAIARGRDGGVASLASSDSANLAYSLPASPLQLQLSSMLQLLPDASERLRDVLRLEYRLLSTLNEQMTLLIGVPTLEMPTVAEAASADPVAAPVLVSATAIANAPAGANTQPVFANTSEPVAPVRIKALPALAPEASAVGNEWLPFTVLGLSLLMAVLWLRRRAAVVATPSLDELQTLVMEHPVAVSKPMSAVTPTELQPKLQPTELAEKTLSAVEPTLRTEFAQAVVLPADGPADINPVMELAEIMLSFGRLDGAAQTLQEYIETNPNEALQPWIKLLDIYRMGGMNTEFEALANKLNQNFNVEVQHWERVQVPEPVDESQLHKATSLEELPHICEQVVAKWGTPACLEYLHQLLHENRGGKRSGFTLPVVQEVLLLIDILVARESTGTN